MARPAPRARRSPATSPPPAHRPAPHPRDRPDLLDRASLERAYAGADAVVLQFPLVYDDRALAMADNAARAAEAAGSSTS